jgi:hypothetical protein
MSLMVLLGNGDRELRGGGRVDVRAEGSGGSREAR